MKFNYLKINNFGKLKNKEIKLENNINLIYGKNESGKTTLLKFISSMLYGISKNKNGKEFSDFDKYTPWNQEEFSGKINYELDNKESFEIFRDFKKKTPKIYNSKLEDISKEFTLDKNKQNQFFYDQTKVDEKLFLSTAIIEQNNTVLNIDEQNNLTQKMANILSSGEDNISYKNIMNKLNKKITEEIGTSRTQERPINIVNEEIKKIENKIELLENSKERKNILIEENKNEKEQIKLLENELKLLKEIKLEKENERIEIEKINVNSNIKNEYEEKIKKIKDNIENTEILKSNKKTNKINCILIPILIILNILINFINTSKIINYIIIGGTCIYLISLLIKYIINKNKNKKNTNEKNINKIKMQNEINILENNILNIEKDIKNINNIIEENKKEKIENIKNKYLNFNSQEIINYFNKNIKELEKDISFLENEINLNKNELNKLEIEEKNINEKLEEYSESKEKLNFLYLKKEELESLAGKYNLIKEELEKSYNKMKEEITPKFTQDLSNLVSKISNGKYKNVKFNVDEGLIIELENGEYINANRLSLGTIDQLYLSLRLSALQEISKEKMPIILDEAFAYYDNDRMENIVKYINENYKENQVIIFSCNKREKEIMDNLKINYNYIELN